MPSGGRVFLGISQRFQNREPVFLNQGGAELQKILTFLVKRSLFHHAGRLIHLLEIQLVQDTFGRGTKLKKQRAIK